MKLSDLAQKFSDYDEKEKAILKRKNKETKTKHSVSYTELYQYQGCV